MHIFAKELAVVRHRAKLYRRYDLLSLHGKIPYRLCDLECIRLICYPRLPVWFGVKRFLMEEQPENGKLPLHNGSFDLIHAAMGFRRDYWRSRCHVLLFLHTNHWQLYAVL